MQIALEFLLQRQTKLHLLLLWHSNTTLLRSTEKVSFFFIANNVTMHTDMSQAMERKISSLASH